MKKRELNICRKLFRCIIDGKSIGYAYIYPVDKSVRQQYVFELTPKNIANLIGHFAFNAEKIIITDYVDNLVCDTFGGFINQCPDKKMLLKITKWLNPILMGTSEAVKVQFVSSDLMDEYCNCFS